MDPTGELARAWAFECANQDRAAGRLRAFEFGTALFDDALRRVYDANFVRFERGFDELDGDAVERVVDELQAGLAHRKVMIPDEAAGARVGAELAARGWRHYTLVTMVYRGPRERPPATRAEQVDPRALRGARDQSLVDGTRDAEARRQIVAYTEKVASAAPTSRLYAAWDEGEIAAFCALFQGGGLGQIEEVATIERHRRRGLGDAVVEAALAGSLADRDEFTFIVADESDWPKDWYRRRGFEVVGRRHEMLRT